MKQYKIDQYFEFTFNTQRFDTGAATDADATPTYRVYEENNDTVIDSGNCAKRDDANTAGYYIARGQCTAALGYEVGKTYEVRVAATVNSVAAAETVGRFLMIPTQVWDSLFGGSDVLDANVATIATDAITPESLKSTAVTEIQDGLATAAALATVDGIVDTIVARVIGTIAAGTHNPQSGDAYAVVNHGTYGNAAIKTQTAAIEVDTQDLQTQIGTDGAGLTNMPWNASWDTQVESEVTDALNTYDPPTKAEMDNAIAAGDDAVLAAVADVPTVAEFEARTLVAADYTVAGDAMTLTAAYDAAKTAAQAGDEMDLINAPNATAVAAISTGVLDLSNGVETSLTPRQALRLITSALAGKLSGAATTTVTIRNYGDAKDRITATVDADGNRSAIIYDLT